MLYNIFDMNGTMVKHMISLRETIHFLINNGVYLFKKEFEKEFNKNKSVVTKNFLVYPYNAKED